MKTEVELNSTGVTKLPIPVPFRICGLRATINGVLMTLGHEPGAEQKERSFCVSPVPVQGTLIGSLYLGDKVHLVYQMWESK